MPGTFYHPPQPTQLRRSVVPAITPSPVVLGLIDQTAATFAPTIIQQQFYTPDLLDRTAVVFDATITTGGAVVEVGLINQAAACFSPTITTGAVNVSLGLIDQTAQTYSPSISGGAVTGRQLQVVIVM